MHHIVHIGNFLNFFKSFQRTDFFSKKNSTSVYVIFVSFFDNSQVFTHRMCWLFAGVTCMSCMTCMSICMYHTCMHVSLLACHITLPLCMSDLLICLTFLIYIYIYI